MINLSQTLISTTTNQPSTVYRRP